MSPPNCLNETGADCTRVPTQGCALGWAATVMSPCGVVNCKVLGPRGPLLTNRMSELLTYGSVGGVGRKPGPYPAQNPAMTPQLHSLSQWRRVCDLERWAKSARFDV